MANYLRLYCNQSADRVARSKAAAHSARRFTSSKDHYMMKAVKQCKAHVNAADVAILDVSESKAKPRPKRSQKSSSKAFKPQPNAVDKVAKFKQAKHVSYGTSVLRNALRKMGLI